MSHSLDSISCLDKKRKHWRVIIETPRGGRHKYKYEPKLQAFTLHRILPEGMSFPLDFGFLPRTLAPDGDPTDVLVLIDDPTFTGCVVSCHLIGVIEAIQVEENGGSQRNDRLIAIPVDSRTENKIRSIKDLDSRQVADIETFFKSYNEVFGKRFKVKTIRGPRAAAKLAREAIRRFDKRSKNHDASRR